MWIKSRPAFFIIIRLHWKHSSLMGVFRGMNIPLPLFILKDLIESLDQLTAACAWVSRHCGKNNSQLFLKIRPLLQTLLAMERELGKQGRIKLVEVEDENIGVFVELY